MRAVLDEAYLTVSEAAALLKVHKSTIRRWIGQGDLPAYRIGRRRVALKRTDVARLVKPARVQRVDDSAMTKPDVAVIRRLSPEQQRQGLRALEELRRLHQRVYAELGDKPLTPSWEILAELRDERSRQLS
jgi:excisionase family DNA binding protein